MPDIPTKTTDIDEFFKALEPLKEAFRESFTYIAIKHKDKFIILKGIIFLNTAPTKIPFTHFQSENVRAGHYTLSSLKLTPKKLIAAALSGEIKTPDGVLVFPPSASPQGDVHGEAVNYATTYLPFHPVGLQNQNRLNVLRISGAPLATYIHRQPFFDWELKAAPTPYDSLQELMSEYLLGLMETESVTIEAIAFNVALLNLGSPMSGTTAHPTVHLANGLPPEKITVGYRIFSQGNVVTRSVLIGKSMQWTDQDGYQQGIGEIKIPNASVLHCVVSYAGIAQHHGWLGDPATFQNPRRGIYEVFDNKLEILSDFLTKLGRGRDTRDLEAGVAWLLWMLGFSVAHLGGTQRTQDAADLIAATPHGHFAVIECTTGTLRTENKLPLLVARAETVRQRLIASNQRHIRVLPVIVTSRTEAEIQADMEHAARLGVLVLCRERLDRIVIQTLILPNTNKLYDEAEAAVRAAQAKYTAQPAAIH